MHPNSYMHMVEKSKMYLDPQQHLEIADIGSMDVNGTFKPIFNQPNWSYIGLDLAPGKNVDVVIEDPYKLPLETSSVDVVISGSVFEHVAFFWLTWVEICRITKSQGTIILIVPSRGPEHKYPIDAWRFYPDSMVALADYTKIELLEAHTDWEGNERGGSQLWGDTVGVFRVP